MGPGSFGSGGSWVEPLGEHGLVPSVNIGFSSKGASRRRLAGLRSDAGWASVDITPLDVTLDYGFDGDDGVEQRLATVLSVTRTHRP